MEDLNPHTSSSLQMPTRPPGTPWGGFFLHCPLPATSLPWNKLQQGTGPGSFLFLMMPPHTYANVLHDFCYIGKLSLAQTRQRGKLRCYFSLMSWYCSSYSFQFGNNSAYITHIFFISTLSFFTVMDTFLETESVFFFQVFISSCCCSPPEYIAFDCYATEFRTALSHATHRTNLLAHLSFFLSLFTHKHKMSPVKCIYMC